MIHLIFIPSLTNHHLFSQFGSTISFQCSLTLHKKRISLSHTLEKNNVRYVLICGFPKSLKSNVNCPNWQKKVSLSQVEKLGFGN